MRATAQNISNLYHAGRRDAANGVNNLNPDWHWKLKDAYTRGHASAKKPTPFTPANRDDWQLPGKTGPATKRKAKLMRKPPFQK